MFEKISKRLCTLKKLDTSHNSSAGRTFLRLSSRLPRVNRHARQYCSSTYNCTLMPLSEFKNKRYSERKRENEGNSAGWYSAWESIMYISYGCFCATTTNKNTCRQCKSRRASRWKKDIRENKNLAQSSTANASQKEVRKLRLFWRERWS